MRSNLKKMFVAGCAAVGVSSMAVAGDFNLGGFIEAGYVMQKTSGTATNSSFMAREASLHAAGKVGNVDGKAQIGYALGSQAALYGYHHSAAPTYGFMVDQAYMTFHPAFMGEDSWWKWGKYDSGLGIEGNYATDNTFLSRSFNYYFQPNSLVGTAIGKNFGMFWAELQVVNSTNANTAADFDAATTNGPGFLLGVGLGSKDSMFLNLHFGLTKEMDESGLLIDVAAGGMFQQLTYGIDFTLGKVGTPKAWGISVMGDYKFTDDMGLGFRFDYAGVDAAFPVSKAWTGTASATGFGADVKFLGITPSIHYAINKNVTGKLEYHMVKPDTAGSNVTHIIAWAAVLSF